MRPAGVVDAAALPREPQDRRSPLWWGILGVIAIEMTVVATLVASYFYLRMGEAGWPPGGVEPPPLARETLNVGLLFAGALLLHWADRQRARGRPRRLTGGLLGAIALLGLVLLLRWLQLRSLPMRWDDHAYGSLVWTLTGFHFLHVASAILVTSSLAALAARGHWTEERGLPLRVDRIYWLFVALAWVPLYLTVYWAERLL